MSSSTNQSVLQRRRDQQEDSVGMNSSVRGTKELSCVSKSDLVPMKDICWFRGGPEIHPARNSLEYSRLNKAPMPLRLRVIVRAVNRPVSQSATCIIVFKHPEIRFEQNPVSSATIELPRGTVLQRLRYSQVTFMGELTPIEGPGVVLRLSDENGAESVVVEVSGMTRSVAETIRGILEARGSPMFIADW